MKELKNQLLEGLIRGEYAVDAGNWQKNIGELKFDPEDYTPEYYAECLAFTIQHIMGPTVLIDTTPNIAPKTAAPITEQLPLPFGLFEFTFKGVVNRFDLDRMINGLTRRDQ